MKMYPNILIIAVGLLSYVSASVLLPEEDGRGVEENIVEVSHNGRFGMNFDECLKKDSISCLQMQIFRMAKGFFDHPSYDIIEGIRLKKDARYANEMRSLDSDGNQAEEKIAKAQDVDEREDVLESYIMDEARNFFEKRDIDYNADALSKKIISMAPESMKKFISDLMTDGRGKSKKLMKMLLPFLIGLKFKFGTLLGLAYLGVILVAKKALALSLLSIAVSVFLLLKKMFFSHTEIYPPAHGGWQSHGDAGHVEYAPPGGPAAQNLAYGGQKEANTR